MIELRIRGDENVQQLMAFGSKASLESETAHSRQADAP
jgi:hypothetical protein